MKWNSNNKYKHYPYGRIWLITWNNLLMLIKNLLDRTNNMHNLFKLGITAPMK